MIGSFQDTNDTDLIKYARAVGDTKYDRHMRVKINVTERLITMILGNKDRDCYDSNYKWLLEDAKTTSTTDYGLACVAKDVWYDSEFNKNNQTFEIKIFGDNQKLNRLFNVNICLINKKYLQIKCLHIPTQRERITKYQKK